MALLNLPDFTGPQQTPLGFTLSGLADQRDDENVDYGLSRWKQDRDFGRAKSDLVDRFSSRGTARGGMLGKASDRMNQDFQFGAGQAELNHRRALDALEAQRRFAALGVYG